MAEKARGPSGRTVGDSTGGHGTRDRQAWWRNAADSERAAARPRQSLQPTSGLALYRSPLAAGGISYPMVNRANDTRTSGTPLVMVRRTVYTVRLGEALGYIRSSAGSVPWSEAIYCSFSKIVNVSEREDWPIVQSLPRIIAFLHRSDGCHLWLIVRTLYTMQYVALGTTSHPCESTDTMLPRAAP